ncbi:MAG: hypothetical protein ACKOU7_13415 [Ferruginibacter sp.]
MKRITAILSSLLLSAGTFAQFNNQLCKPNEEIVFAFQVKNQKWVSVCKEKNGSYIVYRFGTKAKMEMQYPAKLDSASWQLFTFQGYMRGGGKQNAAMRFGYLNFINNDIKYEVYDLWNSEDDKEECGISINLKTKTIGMEGNLKSRRGTLVELIYEDKIKKEPEN